MVPVLLSSVVPVFSAKKRTHKSILVVKITILFIVYSGLDIPFKCLGFQTAVSLF